MKRRRRIEGRKEGKFEKMKRKKIGKGGGGEKACARVSLKRDCRRDGGEEREEPLPDLSHPKHSRDGEAERPK